MAQHPGDGTGIDAIGFSDNLQVQPGEGEPLPHVTDVPVPKGTRSKRIRPFHLGLVSGSQAARDSRKREALDSW